MTSAWHRSPVTWITAKLNAPTFPRAGVLCSALSLLFAGACASSGAPSPPEPPADDAGGTSDAASAPDTSSGADAGTFEASPDSTSAVDAQDEPNSSPMDAAVDDTEAVQDAGQASTDKYYVGGAGASDSNVGTSAKPFATIQKCASVALPGDTCHINTGVYRETVVPPASGTSASPITFAAVAGATVTIDGTDPVSGWTPSSGGIYQATVQLSGTAAQPYSSTEYPPNEELWANQVFIGTSVVPEAAYPAPASDPWSQAFLGGFRSTRSTSNSCMAPPCNMTVTGTLTDTSFPSFGDMTGAVAYFAGGWVAVSATVTGGTLSAANHTLDISFPESDAKVFPGGGNDNLFRLIGKKAFLAAADEWFYDAGSTTLYLWPPSTGAPANVFAKKRNYAFDLRAKAYITVSDIGLFASAITTDTTSDHLTLDGIRGQYLSQWQTAQYDPTLPYAGIYDANHRFDSGIVLHGTNHVLKNSALHLSNGNGVNILGSGTTVTNNTIYDVGYGGTYTAAVTIEVGSHDLAITNNTLYSTGRDVINMNTNLYPNAGYPNVRIAYNDIYDYARIDFDLGGIYACCDTSLSGGRIDHNWIHDPANVANGIHFDNGTYDVSVDHNVIWGLKGTGDVNHGGNGINFGGHNNAPPAGSNLPYLTGVLYNNTIVSGDNYTVFNYFAAAADDAHMTLRNNILDGNQPAGQTFGYVPGGTPVQDHDLVTLFGYDGKPPDPQFIDPASSNFGLQSSSPAVNAGVAITGITDGYVGAAPDEGAYEYGAAPWVAGSTTTP
jgi:hypothetical protein